MNIIYTQKIKIKQNEEGSEAKELIAFQIRTICTPKERSQKGTKKLINRI